MFSRSHASTIHGEVDAVNRCAALSSLKNTLGSSSIFFPLYRTRVSMACVPRERVHHRTRRIVANNFKRLLHDRSLKIADLAERTGAARSVLYKLQNGTMGATVDLLGRLADALQCEPVEFLRVEASSPLSDIQDLTDRIDPFS
jgi:DNA-binding Xre family transcriptional regulator